MTSQRPGRKGVLLRNNVDQYDKVNIFSTITRKLVLLVVTTLLIFIAVIVIHQFLLPVYGNQVFGAVNSTGLTDFNFAAAGDWGCNPESNQTVKNILDIDPELVLGLGDFSYNEKADCWLHLVDPLDHKMKIVIGNHDYKIYVTNTTTVPAPDLLQQYMDHFNLTKQYYSFDYHNVHFVAMSTEIPFEIGSDQYNFVQSDLQNAASDPKIDWIIAFYHRLAYSSPALLDAIPKLRNTYHPLFEKFNVDLVLQAHSHNYQRTYPIKYNGLNTAGPIITSFNKTDYINPSGQVFATVGTGGAPDVHRFSAPQNRFTAIEFNAFGFLNIDVHNGTVLEGKFYENNGTIRDKFTITKPNNPHEGIISSVLEGKFYKNNGTIRDFTITKPNNPHEGIISWVSSSVSSASQSSGPKLTNGYEDKFKIEPVFEGLSRPTDISFLGPGDFLALEKNKGMVQRIVNGQKLPEPLLDANVSNTNERGLLGVAVSIDKNVTKYVYLYYTEPKLEGSEDCQSGGCDGAIDPVGNRLYRYDLSDNGSKLINPKLLLKVPVTPTPEHNGGKMLIDNSNLYIIIGDVSKGGYKTRNTQDGKEPDATGGILRIALGDNASNNGILGNEYPLNLYYAYGIRNGFGLDIDPVSHNLWDTENGPDFGDEINLVKPGFNSGWKDVQGIWKPVGGKPQQGEVDLEGLEDFNGRGHYSEPEFIWEKVVGPTAIKFFNSDRMGTEYKNSIFVGDIHNGNLYHFELSANRDSLLLDGTLSDKIANSPSELNKAIFANGFEGISDLEVGPDGYLYILSIGQGTVYRIAPK